MLKMMAVGPFQANCYILGCNKTKEGTVIDPGCDAFKIVKEVSQAGLKIKYILITHGHFDHTGAAKELKGIMKVPIWIHRLDSSGLYFPPLPGTRSLPVLWDARNSREVIIRD